jgi:hypothetical protein
MNRVHAREVLSLDGVWNFATDPENRGEAEKWYMAEVKLPTMPLPGYAPSANGTIRVPGIWDNQGYGTETEKVRHNFVGTGWYRRQVKIPRGWAGQHVFLTITGASRYAKVWINGQFFGEHVGFLSAFEYDVTQYVAPGQTASITIQVDSKQRWEIDSMYGACTLADYVDVAWGGIWGHVFFEARADCWLSDLFVQPDVANSACSASAALNGNADLADAAKLEVFDKNGRRVAGTVLKVDSKIAAGKLVALKASLPGVELWTPDSPTLYMARLSLLKGNKVLDAVESRFGMRQFTIDGFRLLLNGKPIMLCGYGDDHIYPEQMAMPSDKDLHLSRLRTIKSYGFIFVRHHSTIMPPEYYDACDEIGMISTAEFPICYGLYLPGFGEIWKASVPKGTDPGPALETYKREWAAVIRQYRNHPAILCWVMGNELYEKPRPIAEFAGIARQLDPTRLFLDTDAVSGAPPDEKHDRDTLNIHTFPLHEGSNPIDNPGKFHTPPLKKPAIVHEAGNYITFSRPDLIDQFQHNIKPFWLTGGMAKLKKLGLLQEAGQWAEKSERLYALCHKYNLEALRLNPYLSGYQWWLFQDYWTTSNGIVDHYSRPKSITQEEVLKINNPVVLLQEGLQRTYRGRNRLDLKLLVSNFSAEPLQGELVWEVKVGGQSVARQQTQLQSVPQGELAGVGQIGVELPEIASPTKLNVAMEVIAGEKHFANDWTSWLYPATIRPAASPLQVFADESVMKQLEGWGAKPIPAEGELSDRATYVTSGPLDHRLIEATDRGANVVLLNGADPFLKSRKIPFRTSWWKGTYQGQANHTGTLVYDHPVTRAMAPDGWCDDGWFHLIEGAKKCNLETAPARPDVIIRALPTLESVEDEAVVFEVAVDKGRLIVSGLNHERAAGRPENDWLLARMLDHAASQSHPKAHWPASFLAPVSAAPNTNTNSK